MAEMPTYPRFKPGDQVRVGDSAYPGIWVVEKVNPVNTIVRPLAGGRKLGVPHQMLGSLDEMPAVGVTTEPIPEFYSGGELVRWSNPKDGTEGLYVVLRDNRSRVSIVPIGGGSGTYWRVPHRQLKKVDPKDVLR